MTYFAHEIKKENNWEPFQVKDKADKLRSVRNVEGVKDRLRVVAFAELQARDGFLWGIERFPLAEKEWREYWQTFSQMENRHAQLLLDRAKELDLILSDRAVSNALFKSFLSASSPETFFYLMATAEERGMEIGLSMVESVRSVDRKSAEIFCLCAEEEVEHITVAKRLLKGYDVEALKAEVLFSRA